MKKHADKVFDRIETIRKKAAEAKKLTQLLIGVIIFLVLVIVYLATHQAVYLVPYNMDQKVKLSIHRVTPTYLVWVANADTATFFNIDSSNMNTQDSNFLTRINPNYSGDISVQLKAREKQIKENGETWSFYPGDSYVKKNTMTVVVTGKLVRKIAGKVINQGTQDKVITINYSSKHGFLYINDWRYKNANS